MSRFAAMDKELKQQHDALKLEPRADKKAAIHVKAELKKSEETMATTLAE